MNDRKLKLVILDDHVLFSSLLKEKVGAFDFVQQIETFEDPAIFIDRLPELSIDILILDLMMPAISGREIIAACKEHAFLRNIKIIILSSIMEPLVVREVVKLGANAYLSKNTTIEELSRAISFVINNPKKEIFIAANIKKQLIQMHFQQENNILLSPKEKEVMLQVCKGRTVKEIASALNLSVNSIQSYMKNIFKKFDVNRTPDLILKAIKYGMFIPE